MEQKKRNAFLIIIGALILIIAVFVLLKKEKTTNDNFDEDSVHREWWEKSFIANFIQNSWLSFDYLEMTAEKNNGWIGIDELNYIHYSLTNVELDFSSYADAPVNRYDDSSGYSSGLITGWNYEDTDDGVIVTADFEVETSGSNAVWEQEITVNLVKNPYSCFDGYSIVSLSSKDIPLSVESGEYVFYGMDMTEEGEITDNLGTIVPIDIALFFSDLEVTY